MANRKYTSLPYQEFFVHEKRFDYTRLPIQYIVIHTMVGTMASTRNLFASEPLTGKETSAHYGVSYDGKIDAYLEEYYTAYHCGNYSYNQKSIGIEHEDKGKYDSPRPDALYETSAQLVADIAKYYGIPLDRKHILKHNEVPGSSTHCPGTLDIDKIITRANEINNSTPPMANTIQVDTKVYEMLVQKSSQMDLVADEFSLDRNDNQVGKKIIEQINLLLNSIVS